MHQIITFSWFKKVQHLHLLITDTISKNLLQNVSKFITYCVQEFYYNILQIITKCGGFFYKFG